MTILLRIKKADILRFIIIFLVVINLNLLNFGDYSQTFRYFTSFVSIITYFYCMFNNKVRTEVRTYSYYMNKWIVVLFALMLVEVFIGLSGREGLLEAIGKVHIFTWCLLFYPTVYVIIKYKDGVKVILKDICIWTTITYLVKIFIWWMFNYRGIEIMHYILYEFGEIWLRNDFQRIPAPCFSGILFATMLYKVLQPYKLRKKIVPILIIMIQLFYANYVFASRAQLISFVGAAIAALVLHRSKSEKKIIEFSIIIVMTIVVIASESFNDFIASLSTHTSSIGNRLYAFNHFFNLLKGNWFFGFQHIYDGNTINGFLGISYLSDTGILENLFCWGIIGFIITLIPFMRMLFICFNKRIKQSSHYVLLITLFLYTLFSTILSNNVYDSNLLFAFPFICALFEVIYIDAKVNMNK
ncbi:hypothetical protein DWW36_06300 [Erysipelotrichaceae bacterium AF15-26LB]|nr:hypothetical protein HMPREF0983_03231 [Erysipelotrichaceae bacterium 3_1_53]MCR0348698.1 hypothetical protein [[Clostridium] innocuum]RJV90003.1 hypothetical protein DWX45_09895 [Erysipelotrichaceae bacterium AF19-24AC]RJV90550.1 hypothetical protein DWW36_06300 [Erysipelotrichaceae bacterium AF15-26LB]